MHTKVFVMSHTLHSMAWMGPYESRTLLQPKSSFGHTPCLTPSTTCMMTVAVFENKFKDFQGQHLWHSRTTALTQNSIFISMSTQV